MAEFNEAEYYENNSAFQKKLGLDLIKKLAPERGSSVLDLGCGTGFLTKTLADLVGPEGKVVGVDPDRERLEIAREKYSASNVEYLEGNAECIPGDLMFDVVLCNAVLHWCKDKEKVLKQVRAKLKPGGKFGFSCQNEEVAKQFFPVVSPELAAAFISKLHYMEWSKLSQIATDNQFEILEKKFLMSTNKHKGVSEFVDFMRTHIGIEFDMTHYNVDAVREHFWRDGEICQEHEMISVVLQKS